MSQPDPRYNARPIPWPPPVDWIPAWGVPYRRVPGFRYAYQAVINLEVLELRSCCTMPEIISFVVDTGTDMTIIPRTATHSAFGGPPLEWISVEGLIPGPPLLGGVYRAAISIPRSSFPLAPFSFGVMKPIVLDSWPHEHGMLGLDAFRRVVAVSSREYLRLSLEAWLRPPAKPLVLSHP
jgi:hypothetical protein